MEGHIIDGAVIKRALNTNIFLKFASLLLGFIFQIFIAKTLSSAEFASYAILFSFLMTAERILSFGIDRTIMRFIPTLTQRRDIAGLRLIGIRIGQARLVSLAFAILAMMLLIQFANLIVPVRLDTTIVIAFGIWLVASILLADADALAQSWMAQRDTAIITTFEILARIVLISLLYLEGLGTGVGLIFIACACTSTVAVTSLIYRLMCRFRIIRNSIERSGNEKARLGDDLDVIHAPMFAAGTYASTISWLISSAGVIRIVAATGLDVVALAAFSFVQGFYTSLQRAFPGLLIVPSLEPILMAQLARRAREDQMFAALSIVFKLELICVLAVLIVTTFAGFYIIEIMSKQIYAPYYFIFPALIISQICNTIYRILEIIASMSVKQKVFLLLWPFGLISTLLIYATVSAWGFWSVLLLPIAEGILRISILLIIFRHDGVWHAFDPRRSLYLVLSAVMVIMILFALKMSIHTQSAVGDIFFAFGGIVMFAGSIFIVRPMRPIEYNTLVLMLPESWIFARKAVGIATRP